MFDVFTEEIEVQVKAGVANLYWYKKDLKKAWLRSGVLPTLCDPLFSRRNEEGYKLSKRELMDQLYEELRSLDYNRRLEISRNFVRLLIEHENFVPQAEKHRVEIAERCALKLRDIIAKQQKQQEYRDRVRRKAQAGKKEDYFSQLSKLSARFQEVVKLQRQERGYELEKIFTELMKISAIPVEQPFRVVGEQIDGAIKYDAHFYLIELRWAEKKAGQSQISSLYLKVEGKFETRGIFIAMNGYPGTLESALPKGKKVKVLLLDGIHLANVFSGLYTFRELLEHAISQASVKCDIYCSHDLA